MRRISKSTGSLPGSAAPGSRRSAQKRQASGLRAQALRRKKSVRRPRSERRDTSTHRGHGNEQIEKESKTAGPLRGNGGATGSQRCNPSKTLEDSRVCNGARRCAPARIVTKLSLEIQICKWVSYVQFRADLVKPAQAGSRRRQPPVILSSAMRYGLKGPRFAAGSAIRHARPHPPPSRRHRRRVASHSGRPGRPGAAPARRLAGRPRGPRMAGTDQPGAARPLDRLLSVKYVRTLVTQLLLLAAARPRTAPRRRRARLLRVVLVVPAGAAAGHRRSPSCSAGRSS